MAHSRARLASLFICALHLKATGILEMSMHNCRRQLQVLVRGDILLGGLFPVHEAGLNGSECGLLKAAQGVQRLQAMLFALEAVNADNTVLPGIALGAQILDTCSVDSHALEQTLVFIKTMMSSGDGIICMDGSRPTYSEQPVAAVIGAASSQVSVMVASMLQLFKVIF
uniref:ANF_receptor domain-containing protein n=1 Tax=Ascaris lumbricoides TaxID=6252 RepID=A0A0M3HUT6_ASCLU